LASKVFLDLQVEILREFKINYFYGLEKVRVEAFADFFLRQICFYGYVLDGPLSLTTQKFLNFMLANITRRADRA
jgi:hypothetical protein